MAKSLFFNSSREASTEITTAFDFLWPTALAIWMLRKEVNDFAYSERNPKQEDFINKFGKESRIRGVNFRKVFIEQSWDEQQQTLSRFLLIDLVSIYEAWAEKILLDLGSKTKVSPKALQFPSDYEGAGAKRAIQEITTPASEVLRSAFYKELRAHKLNSLSNLDDLLLIYRYFKECRNCIVHKSGIVDSKLQSVSERLATLSKSTTFPMAEFPKHFEFRANEHVKLALRGVVGFSDVLLRLIATIDAELSISKKAEKVFISRWREFYKKDLPMLKSRDKSKRKRQIIRLTRKLGLPTPRNLKDYDSFIVENKLAK